MTIKHLGDLIIWAGAVAAGLSAIGWLVYRLFVRPGVRWLREQVTETRTVAEAVHAEVTPNHGGSLKDAVTRTEIKVDALSQRLADHISNHPGASV